MIKKLFVGLCFLGLLVFAGPAKADVVSLKPGVIMVYNQVTEGDFKDFYAATIMDESIKHYKIVLQTPGGSAWSCIAIMNRMQQLQARGVTFTTEVYGMATSAATYIFMMGDKRVVHQPAMLMFHGVLAQLLDYRKESLKRDFQQEYNVLVRVDEYIINHMIRVTGWSYSVADYWLNGGKAQYMSAQTAYNTGFATHYYIDGGI